MDPLEDVVDVEKELADERFRSRIERNAMYEGIVPSHFDVFSISPYGLLEFECCPLLHPPPVARHDFIARSTIALLPMNNGQRWCSSVGVISRIRVVPSVAIPPACSTIMASGFASYNNRSLPFGAFVVPG